MSSIQPPQVIVVQSEPRRGTNGLAIAGFVLSLLWGYGALSLLAIIFSAIGMHQCKERNQGGNGLAVAGLVIGILGLVAAIIIIAIAASASSTATYSY